MNKVTDLYPQGIWKHFQNICNTPHPSHHEEKIVNYVIEFGKRNNLRTYIDKAGNVILKKGATKGFENKKTILLQAHLDMVPQKNSRTAHDFTKDPIDIYIEKGWVTAKNTTLGADNGIGVASILALLESTSIEHGPIEALLTIEEETGMRGAFELEENLFDADILLNTDSEDENELIIGCAGGIDVSAYGEYTLCAAPENYSGLNISITGLKGGHSGIDIILGRANANVLMGRLLSALISEFDAKLVEIKGGNMRNAIPREAFATLLVPEENTSNLTSFLQSFNEMISKEFHKTENLIHIEFKEYVSATECIDDKTTSNIIKALVYCPNGVIRMDEHMEGVVETSTNLSVVTVSEGKIEIHNLLRSSKEDAKIELAHTLEHIFSIFGFKVEKIGSYPGWNPNVQSKVLELFKVLYPKVMNKEPEVKVIHAGLECGVINEKYPKLDMISFGPTIKHPHSPDEKVEIKSVEKYWELLCEVIKNIDEIDNA